MDETDEEEEIEDDGKPNRQDDSIQDIFHKCQVSLGDNRKGSFCVYFDEGRFGGD